VLSQEEFAAAVRVALRDYAQAEPLSASPLLQSRVVVHASGVAAPASARVAALRALIVQATDALQATPRHAKLYRALYHTYIQPAPTQEQAAELLDLPFSTFRRHLKDGIEHIVEQLWQKEIGE
jgi:hypothetical protein